MFGGHSIVGKLRRALVKRPEEAFLSQEHIDQNWRALHFLEAPDFEKAKAQHAHLVRVLNDAGCEVLFFPADDRTTLDSIYTQDPLLMTDFGAIVLQPGKEQRRGEAEAVAEMMQRLRIPVLGRLEGAATAECGDMSWLDSHTLLIGRGFRTNREGIDAVRNLLELHAVSVLDFDLPYWTGPGDVLHLMSFLSILDVNLAIVYKKLMPVPLYQLLLERGYELIDVPDQEYDSLGCNVLALAPRHVVLLRGNPDTKQRLAAAGCIVEEIEGSEIAWKGSGGPTCLTRPILRDARDG